VLRIGGESVVTGARDVDDVAVYEGAEPTGEVEQAHEQAA
jgi:hypothetical protein